MCGREFDALFESKGVAHLKVAIADTPQDSEAGILRDHLDVVGDFIDAALGTGTGVGDAGREHHGGGHPSGGGGGVRRGKDGGAHATGSSDGTVKGGKTVGGGSDGAGAGAGSIVPASTSREHGVGGRGRVLVHCAAGGSRSAAFIIGCDRVARHPCHPLDAARQLCHPARTL